MVTKWQFLKAFCASALKLYQIQALVLYRNLWHMSDCVFVTVEFTVLWWLLLFLSLFGDTVNDQRFICIMLCWLCYKEVFVYTQLPANFAPDILSVFGTNALRSRTFWKKLHLAITLPNTFVSNFNSTKLYLSKSIPITATLCVNLVCFVCIFITIERLKLWQFSDHIFPVTFYYLHKTKFFLIKWIKKI